MRILHGLILLLFLVDGVVCFQINDTRIVLLSVIIRLDLLLQQTLLAAELVLLSLAALLLKLLTCVCH